MIEVEALTFTYPHGNGRTLDGLTFRAQRGEIFGFLGPSGAGKSTTQNILTGTLTGFSGEVRVLGDDVRGLDADYYGRIGVSFETPNVYNRLTAAENLRFFASLRHDAVEAPERMLDMVGLADSAGTRAAEFSKGMKMRLNLCRAFLGDPELLFLDEPTTGQDPANARRIRDLIDEQRSRGKTVFLTTHDMSVATELCDRVAFIAQGRIATIGKPRALMIEHGRKTVRVEFKPANGEVGCADFELSELGSSRAFHEILRDTEVVTMHSQEATLEDVFLEVTGTTLGGE